MSLRTSLATLLTLALCACDSSGDPSSPTPATAPAPAAAPAPAPAPSAPTSNIVSCAEHYAEARDTILGILRGTETMSLIAVTTQHSTNVLSPLPAGTSLADANCRAPSRSLRGKRKPATTPAWPLAPECAALIERIDTVCLKPLAERGEPLNQTCNLTLNGLASAETNGLAQHVSNGGFCESLTRDL